MLKVKLINQVRMVAIISCLSLMAVAFLPGANAQGPSNRQTTVTFSQPVEVPGVGAQTLPAGTYLFKLLETKGNRNIVQIFNEGGTHVFTTILAIANYRMQPAEETIITFAERPQGQPPAIREWFYPGEQWGHEFVYPKTEAVILAKAANQPVLAIPEETKPTPEELESAPVVAVQSSGEESAAAEVVGTPADLESTQTASAQPAAEAPLPKTASDLPLLALIGLILLGAWLALSAFIKRNA